MQDFSGQVAVVTGGAQGIGLAVGTALARRGARVCLVDLSEARLHAALAQLQTDAPEQQGAIVQPCDVADAESSVRAVKEVLAAFGRIDVLVQAAGITGKTNVLTEDVEPANFDEVVRVNLRGIFLMCRAVLPVMVRQGYGRICNIASIAGKEGNAGMLAYSASKAAVIGLTKTIGKEYAEKGICCNALAPAVVRTAMVAAMPDAQVKYMTDKIPMKRTGELEEIASMVCFIVSKACSFTTGFIFDATGGRATY
ncbi:hypothetical protein AB1Y20_010482 [Prymnesium parvum]|uniref:Uncharacterized protein n=1 Tax=Prymnesium parvum TaxID=97485 RepID=A0AB34IPD9_PRYPA